MLHINSSWKKVLQKNLDSEEFRQLQNQLETYINQQTIYPPSEHILEAYNCTLFHDVKVVILGQDPYHKKGQAHGLSFSVQKETPHPPSLKNILKELKNDLNIEAKGNGNLINWAQQGVLLLNSVLTVQEGKAGSHNKIGWQQFTDATIRCLSEQKNNLVFILWGNYAQQKEALIDKNKHLIIKSVHPSPLSAHKGFFGSKPFSRTNRYLTKHGIEPINWQL